MSEYAFPQPMLQTSKGVVFPNEMGEGGLKVLDYFAALIAGYLVDDYKGDAESLAKEAYAIARALCAEKDKEDWGEEQDVQV